MDWANERWIRLYTRDTGDWLMWPWQTRALFLFILRKVDRAGTMQLGKGKLQALAAMCHMPSQDVTEWIEPLLEDGCVQIHDGVLVVPNFQPAQETGQTDKARQQASRERTRSRALSATERHAVSQSVTAGHDASLQDKTRVDKTDEREEDARPSEVKLKSVPPLPPDPPEAAPPPREPEGRVSPTRPTGAASGESGYDLATRVWNELWSAKYHRAYEPSGTRLMGPGSEDAVLVDIGGRALIRGDLAEAYLRHKIAAYLRDKGDRNWLVDNCHPLRCLTRDWAKYGEPKEPKPMVPRQVEEVPAPVSPDAMAAYAKMAAGIGRGGTT